MNEKISQFKAGLKDGIPIGLGYLAVSFTFGIMAKGAGLTTLEAVVLSFTNLTSAGQFAGLGIITAGSSLVEMAMAQLIINLRYCLMSCSLSQKLDSHMPFFHRFLMSYGVTDEIFGVSVCKSGVLSPYFSYGLMAMAVPGWTIGTLLGAVSGSLLPARLLSALNVALYGMFLAVVIPPARENKVLRMVILVSMALSFLFTQIPVLRDISSGFKIIILTFIVAGSAAVLFPCKGGRINEISSLSLHSGNGNCDISDPYAAIDTDQERDQKSFYPLFFILCALCYPVCNDLPGHYLRNCFSCFRSCRFGSGTVFRL